MSSGISTLQPVGHSVLLASIHSLDEPPSYLASVVATAAEKSTQRLRIVLVSACFNGSSVAQRQTEAHHPASGSLSHTERWDDVQRLLTFVYVQATKVAQDMGRVLMDIDVLLYGSTEPFREDVMQDVERVLYVPAHDVCVPPVPADVDIVALQADAHTPPGPRPGVPPADPPQPSQYPVVALGGTFDHLHAGHKILLSMAAWITSERLIVGVTDDALLANKAHKAALEALPVRIARTRAFLALFRPGLCYDVVPISDVYGPTAWDPAVRALVVSKETLPGAASIHALRAEKALCALRTFVIDVISSTEASVVDSEDAAVLKRAKMSSTFIREWIVKNRTEKM